METPMTPSNKPDLKIAVIAPNVSENLSGEAIKAYQYIKHLVGSGAKVTVICHARSRGHFEDAAAGADIRFVEDDAAQKLLWTTKIFRPFVTVPFFLKARRIVQEIAATDPDTVFHYLCPVSPIYPRMPAPGVRNVLGPLTGNIYFPPALRDREPYRLRWRRLSHYPAQRVLAALSRDKAKFERILISGGGRTAESVKAAGGRDEQLRFVLDSGVSDRIINRAPVEHTGPNYRFVCNGRLDPHKGVDLAIRAVAKTKTPATLDVFGKGFMEEKLRELIKELGLESRVAMRGWMPSHDDLLDEMTKYRGFVFPSMAEANGIVVQEALVMGLPVICLDWGGPAVLTTDKTARRIEPRTEEYIVNELAAEMDLLAENPALAAERAEAGLAEARARFSWPAVARQWTASFSTASAADQMAIGQAAANGAPADSAVANQAGAPVKGPAPAAASARTG